MLHKTIRKHVSRVHAHIQEHGHKRALVMVMSSMVMMFYPYFSTKADNFPLPSGGNIEIQYDHSDTTNTDVVATLVATTASGFTITNNDGLSTHTFTDNGSFVFEYSEDGVTGTVAATVNWIDKIAPTGTVTYSGDGQIGPVTAILQTSETTTPTNSGGTTHTFTGNGTFLFEFVDLAGNTGSYLAEVTTINNGPAGDNGTGNTGTGDNGTGDNGTGDNGTGGTGGLTADICPNGDYSPTSYDGDCGQAPVVLTGITGIVTYDTGTIGQVIATATGFNMAGVFAIQQGNSLSHTFTSAGSYTFLLLTTGGNTGSLTATVTSDMFTTGTVNTGNTTGTIITPPSSTGANLTGVCGTGDLVLTGALGGVYSLTTPFSIGGSFAISWIAANNDCNPNQIVTVQLRDHNGQWITLGTGTLDSTGLVFKSTGLAYTGLYTITGVHLSGSTYTYIGQSGQQLTGAYTVDTPYTIYTGIYTGAYTGLWTGYEIRILNASGTNLLSGARPFTIDNTIPLLTGFSFTVAGANGSGVVGSGGTFALSFVGSELLKNIQLLVNDTLIKSFTGGAMTGYALTGGFGETNLSGAINYIVVFTDLAGNTGSVTGTNIYTIDTKDPTFHSFTISGSALSGVKFSWNTSKLATYNLLLTLSGAATGVVFANPITTVYGTMHNYTAAPFATGKTYLFSIKISDALQNTNFMSGTIAVNASGAVALTIATQGNNILQLSSQVEAKLFSQILKEEIQKFEMCKSDIEFKSTTVPLRGNKSIELKIPTMTKSTTKTIVQAFSLMLLNKLKTANLSASELDETETKVNNFFVILKLLRDDNGECQQNLSAYYIGQFERIMEDMLK